MNTAILKIVGTVHCSQVFVQNYVTGLALAVVTGAPSGSQNNSYICCCFISGTCAHSNCGGALVHRRKEKHWSVSFLFISYISFRGTTGDSSTGDTSTSADDSLSCY